MGVVSYFPSLYEQPDFKTYTVYNESEGQYAPVSGVATCFEVKENNYRGGLTFGNMIGGVKLIMSNFNSPVTIPPTFTNVYMMFDYCPNFYSNIYVQTNQLTNVSGFVYRVRGANIYIKPEMESLFRQNDTWNSIKQSYITWTNDADNHRFYNSYYNINVFYNYEG